jgi:hypothetical protein
LNPSQPLWDLTRAGGGEGRRIKIVRKIELTVKVMKRSKK